MFIYCDRPTRASVAAVSENAVHGLKLLYFVCFIHDYMNLIFTLVSCIYLLSAVALKLSLSTACYNGQISCKNIEVESKYIFLL